MDQSRTKFIQYREKMWPLQKRCASLCYSFLNTTSCMQIAGLFCLSFIATWPMHLQTRITCWWCSVTLIQSTATLIRATLASKRSRGWMNLIMRVRKTSCVRMRTISRACQCWKAAIQSPSRRSTTPWTSQRSQRGRKRNFTRETSSTCWPRMSKTQKTRI